MASTQSISVSPFPPARRSRRPRCRLGPALRSTSSSRLEATHGGWLDFAGHPSVGTACALVMKQHIRLSDPIRLILEENVGPVIVDVAPRNGGFHGTLMLSGKIEAPTGAPF